MRLLTWLDRGLLGQQGHLFGWAPVFFGAGIALYFGLRVEPGWAVHAGLILVALVCVLVRRRMPDGLRALPMAAALVLAGVVVAGVRAHAVAEPVLGFRYYGPVEGRVIEIDRSASDAQRLTLDNVVLRNMPPDRTPARVRVSLHGSQDFIDPAPGQTVILTAHLSPPAGPVEPGGFDFRRMAWFERLGAVGYTRTPVLLASPAEAGSAGLAIYRFRVAISAWVQAALPDERGAFAAAIMTGDRSAMGQEVIADLRAANLAHLLAISGLHMGLLTGFVFAVIRNALLLWPGFTLRRPAKKYAAMGALVVAAGYYAMSGGNVATERAFIMVGVILVAVMLDRRALTLRAVAIAAMIVLVLRPEALSGPGFQMSFAATTALVAVFGWLRRFDMDWLPRRLRPALGVVLSSLVAGLATAPFAAAHFNQVSHYGLLANVLAVPVMGTVVMPAAVLTVVLVPLGLSGAGLWLMGLGIRWILGVADRVAGLEGAVGHVHSPAAPVLGLLALGALVVVLWQGRGRLAGLAPMVLAAVIWAGTERPALLVADSGALVGVMGPEGRALSKPRGDGFAARAWLENDGAPVPQAQAHARPGMRITGRRQDMQIGATRVLAVRGKLALAEVVGCDGAAILVSNQQVGPGRDCTVLDLGRLRERGAVAGYLRDEALDLVSVRDRTGDRLWNSREARLATRPAWR
ncbi:ComEC/Rec2 family competence protein [Salibaculum halophilum]|uniref:ComEC/Rec2 family competence protein n=1 Tax=Salibaculum halophilum TaxID=1914408 RepID=UPI000A12046F|nr:ComEC/Rec2 family competence protein [Salibaculum halophilum]